MKNILPKFSNYPNFVGYPLFYIVENCKCECNECASSSQEKGESVEAQVNYDNEMLYCETCSERIAAVYIADEDDESDDECSVYTMRSLGSERHFYI